VLTPSARTLFAYNLNGVNKIHQRKNFFVVSLNILTNASFNHVIYEGSSRDRARGMFTGYGIARRIIYFQNIQQFSKNSARPVRM